MRLPVRLLFAVLPFAAPLASAFDSQTWLGRRAMLTCEAERLREAFETCRAKARDFAEGLAIPLETYEDGTVKLTIAAERAQIFAETQLVYAEGVVIRRFDVDGKLLSRIAAKKCVIDRTTKSGWAEGATKIDLGKTVFSGEGFYFSSTEGYVISFAKSKIVSTDMKLGGAL